jgi:hypothetical protein
MVIILYFQGSLESWYFGVPVICLVLGLLRRWQYKKLLKSSAERDARNKKKK